MSRWQTTNNLGSFNRKFINTWYKYSRLSLLYWLYTSYWIYAEL